jgi:glutathione S-transferase
MIYLCEQAGDTKLWPRSAPRHDVLRWMFWAAEHFRQPAPIYFEERLAARFMDQPADESRIAEANRRIARFAPVLDAHLENRTYVVGNHVTLADFDLAAPLSQMSRTGVPYHNYPHIMRWYQRLADEVPAWRVTGERLDERMDRAITAAGIRRID